MSAETVIEQAINWERERADLCRRHGRGIEPFDMQDAFLAGVQAGRELGADFEFSKAALVDLLDRTRAAAIAEYCVGKAKR